MAVVLIGPSSVGKSAFLETGTREKYLDSKYTDVVFGYELKTKPITRNSIVHYNMLYQGRLSRHRRLVLRSNTQRWSVISRNWDFSKEPVFSKIFDSGTIERCIVLVSPIQELIDRIQARVIREETDKREYPREFWIDAITHLSLYRIYEQLFENLDQRSMPYQIYFSSKEVNGFAPTDRVYVHANLRGRYIPLPDKSQVEDIARNPDCLYQSVLLPYGIITHPKHYKHLPDDRDSILKGLLPDNIVGSSILDVGSAMGGLLFLAERMGAERLVGIELDEKRYAASILLANLLKSHAELKQCDFLDFDQAEQFDHVFILNVIHHVNDFYNFIRKAARHTLKTLTLEFPTLDDNKFARFHKLSQDELRVLNRLPLIGVSSDKGAGQSFVYSPEAVKHLIMNEIGGFDKCEVRASAFKERVVLKFVRRE